MSDSGNVFNIQRFSIHDGPGIRTTVFLKGCTLACFWCHNPEGRHTYPEIQFFPERCIVCGACVGVCQHSAHEICDNAHVFHRELCQNHGACAEVCYAQALQFTGQVMSVPDVVEEVLRDRAFYESSGGGVTLSGGEPSLSTAFALEILGQCKNHHLHTAIETCGDCPWSSLEPLLPVTDLIMMDIKHMVGDRHRSATGRSNERILDNARKLALREVPIIFRTPVVPTVNDSPEEIREIASFVKALIDLRKGCRTGMNGSANITYELLTFHRLSSDKYRSLGLGYLASGMTSPTGLQMRMLADVVGSLGIAVTVR